jgi:hypothetical protein
LAITCVTLVAWLVVVLSGTAPSRPAKLGLFTTGPIAAFAFVGVIVSIHRPRNAIGWIFGVAGAAGAYSLLAASLRGGQAVPTDGISPDAVMDTVAFIVAVGLPLTFGLLLFPNGRLPSPRWRPVALLDALVFVWFISSSLAKQIGRLDPEWELAGSAAVFIPVLATVGSLVARFRHSDPVQREQLKWVATACGLAVTVLALTAASSRIDPAIPGNAVPLLSLSFALFPLAAGVAILRYRLYDIDVLINRTLVYGTLSAIVVGAYGASVILLQALLRPVTSGSELAVAGSTLVVVALFQPIRQRIQAAVDHRFYRSRYDAARTLDAFTTRMRDQVDIDAVRNDVLDVVGTTVRPAHASVWLRETSG